MSRKSQIRFCADRTYAITQHGSEWQTMPLPQKAKDGRCNHTLDATVPLADVQPGHHRANWSASAGSPSWLKTRPSSTANTKINIVDTPGHSDFRKRDGAGAHHGGRVMLCEDASEGPLPQTRYALSKALAGGSRRSLFSIRSTVLTRGQKSS